MVTRSSPWIAEQPPSIRHGNTAQRPQWQDLPATVQDAIRDVCGHEVVEVTVTGSGFTPGFAALVHCADGRSTDGHVRFVKAAWSTLAPWLVAAYTQEVAAQHTLSQVTPAGSGPWSPKLLASSVSEDLVVLCYEAVPNAAVTRPWKIDEAEQTLATLGRLAQIKTPEGCLTKLRDDPGIATNEWPRFWEETQDYRHHEEISELMALVPEALTGTALCHGDVRDDNVLLRGHHDALLCDWNYVCAGPQWVDSMSLLISMYGDGLDADHYVNTLPVFETAAADHLDAFLAVTAGMFLYATTQPEIPTSPQLKPHRTWYAHACSAWLAERRGWKNT